MLTWILIILGVLLASFILFIVLTAWVLSHGFKARDEEAKRIIEQYKEHNEI